RRLSVFAGGWTLEAAEQVSAHDGPDTADNSPDCSTAARRPSSMVACPEVLDLLTSLVDKSLVSYEAQGSEGRYRFLETVRQYSSERLEEAGEAEAVRDRHVAFFVELAEDAEAHLTSAEQGEWLERLETELDNLRAALDWASSRS